MLILGILISMFSLQVLADPAGAPGYDRDSGYHREEGGAYSGSGNTSSAGTGSTGSTGGTQTGGSTSSPTGGDRTGGSQNNNGGLSFGPGVGSVNNSAISSGGRLSFPDSVTNGNNINPNTGMGSSGLSMGRVVGEVQKSGITTGSQGNTTGTNGGFDSAGNFYNLGTPVPSVAVASRGLISALAGLLSGITVPGAVRDVVGAAQSVATHVVNSVGQVVAPQAKAISSGFQSSLTAAQNTLQNSLDELSKPAIRNALIATGNLQNAVNSARRIASEASQRAFYSGATQKYDELAIPENRRWLAGGPVQQAYRHMNPTDAELAAAKLIDQSFLVGPTRVLVPDRYAIITPGFMSTTASTGFNALNAVQKIGALNSITVIADKATLASFAKAYGLSTTACTDCRFIDGTLAGVNLQGVGPTIGGMVLAVDDLYGKYTEDSKLEMVDTLIHEWVHAGDVAISEDINRVLDENRASLSPEQIAELEERQLAANKIVNDRDIGELSDNLEGLINDGYVSNIEETRAFNESIFQGQGMIDRLVETQNVSVVEATAMVGIVRSDPVLNEIDRLMTEHANEMLNRN